MTEWINEITPLLALWGALISTILGIIKINDMRRKILVKTKFELILNEEHGISDLRYFEDRLTLQCMNNGKRPLEIIGCGFQLDNKQKNFYTDPAKETNELPKTINDGQNIIITIDIEQFLDALIKSDEKNKSDNIHTKKIRGYFIAGMDKEYFSKKINFNAIEQLGFFPELYKKYSETKGKHETSK